MTTFRVRALALAVGLVANAAAQRALPGPLDPKPNPRLDISVPEVGDAYWPLPAETDVDYTYESVTSHAWQRFNLFRPAGDPPPGGWPVVLNVNNLGYVTSERYTLITEDLARSPTTQNPNGFYWLCLEAGVAVVSASTTVAAGGDSQNKPAEDFNDGQPGGGVFFPPGWDQGGIAFPYEDLSRPMVETDLVMLVQYLRLHADELGIDPDRIVGDGFSAAAHSWAWVAFGPDHAGTLERGPQGDMSTRLNGIMLRNGGPVVWEVYDGSIIRGPHFADASEGAPWDFPVLFIEDAFQDVLFANSINAYDLPASNTWALNDALPVYLHFDNTPVGDDFVEPFTPGTETNLHTVLMGWIWKARHPQQTFLVTRPSAANGLADATLSGPVTTKAAGAMQFEWLAGLLGLD